MQTVRWGVLGTGGIAADFVVDLGGVEGAEIVAVGSRTRERAHAFGDRHAVRNRHGSVEALVTDPEVDVVYVATPHPMHAQGALAAIAAGKHVLVEKPFTMDAAEARTVVAAARRAGVFCMEAMWTRFLPLTVQLLDLLAGGAVGEIRTVVADHGQQFAPDPAHRLYAPELGGGALLDLGVYPVSWASMLLGRPARVAALSDPAMTGVDGQTSAVLTYPGGAHALVTCTLWALSPRRAWVTGTGGSIEVEAPFYAPPAFTLLRAGEPPAHHVAPTDANRGPGKGLRFEAAEVVRCLREGRTESPGMPLDETIAVMETLDEIRDRAAAWRRG